LLTSDLSRALLIAREPEVAARLRAAEGDARSTAAEEDA
jgi:hypothetical protein